MDFEISKELTELKLKSVDRDDVQMYHLSDMIKNKPFQTNTWFNNLFLGETNNRVFTDPYVLTINKNSIEISLTESHTVIPQAYWNNIESIFLIENTNSFLENVSQDDNYEITFVGDIGLSVHTKHTFKEGTLLTLMLKGMPYFTTINQDVPLTITINKPIIEGNLIDKNTLQLKFEGEIWYILILSNDQDDNEYFSKSIINSQNQLVINNDQTINIMKGNYILKIIKSGAETIEMIELINKTKCCIATDIELVIENNLYSFEYTSDIKVTTCSEGNYLHLCYTHQDNSITYDDSITKTSLRYLSNSKGLMKGLIGNKWVFKMDEIFAIPSLFVDTSAINAELLDCLTKEIEDEWVVPTRSNYFGGKALYKYAELTQLAYKLKHSKKDLALSKLREKLNIFSNNLQDNFLVYDNTHKGVVGNLGLIDKAEDFYGSLYNDSHFHFGYIIGAFGILANLTNNNLTEREFNYVNLLILNINGSKLSKYFPMYRAFNFFEGHSFANGITDKSNDGNNQESSSEDLHCWYSLNMYAKYTNQPDLLNLTNIMLQLNIQSIQSYWFMKSDSNVHPLPFKNNKIVGILFNNKADHTTWFGNNLEFIHGIHMMPYTSALTKLRNNEFVKEEWEFIGNYAKEMDNSNPWKSVLMLNYSQIDSTLDTYNFLKTAILDDGMTRSYTLYMCYTNWFMLQNN